MPTALQTFTTDYEGERVTITRDETWVSPDHELASRFPERFGPDTPRRRAAMRAVTRYRGRSGRSGAVQAPARREAAKPSWHLPPGPRPPAPPTDQQRRTARHEASHAAAAHLLGWEIHGLSMFAAGRSSGHCNVVSPKGCDGVVRAKQFAVICFAAELNGPWTAHNAYASDQQQAIDGLYRTARDPGEAQMLRAAMIAQARALVASPRFRYIAKRIEQELLERKKIGPRVLERLLAEAERDAWRRG